MFPVARAALSLTARGFQRTAVRQAHRKHEPDFHDKYGNLVLLGGTAVFTAVWGYVLTQAGIQWGLSPVGRITPKEWRE
ncbi:cytochrome c oxidase subunit 7B, mitochondrial [Falco biarmicus]|uniref:cytochrome c oxidase subunit 7B, mitochondrial n=1 Tax=Falco peregrinus TaxID=8954 RepID=UPI000386F4E9|nr:cytochrome c oxidase subunit 7B, mitochondrial [Falco peregrinus]XP_005434498.1 cytochrome c oxidase subunit 7B, mitochondrial [Falco cherrug]XP_037264393.1 cytochrome c oxidase subunit 7B, mitochondrial [Falco rusticolus]XP_056216033.1 cytochrome c oxidase subunit 7B, mitochondrial [Falco biarmicus]